MAVFISSRLVAARRTRDAVRQIRRFPIGDRDKKHLLTEWFKVHRRAAPTRAQKRAAYDQVLSRARNARLIG